MTMIVAAHFERKAQADGAVKALIGIGIAADHIKSSYEQNALDWAAADPFATHTGTFSRALDELGMHDGGAGEDATVMARAVGVLLAVDAPDSIQRTRAADILGKLGGRRVVESERTWVDGRWAASEPAPDSKAARRPS